MMSRPNFRLFWMAAGLIGALIMAFLLFPEISAAFWHNPILNTGIFIVLAIGILSAFWQVLSLKADIDWVESFQRGRHSVAGIAPPRLLAPIAAMLKDKEGSRISLSPISARSLLDGLQARLDEGREISRYLITLLILLGLLGTFWGLLGTINAVAKAIATLDLTSSDPATMFQQLKASLQSPLNGMGTAFSASLFGLSGSLLLGYIDLQAGQARNRFFSEFEDWLSGQARLTSSGPMMEGEQPIPVYIQALLEQTAESLDNLQRTIAKGESDRVHANASVKAIGDHLAALSDHLRSQTRTTDRMAEEWRQALQRWIDVAETGNLGIDPASRAHLRNLDTQTARLVEELATRREGIVEELRAEIKLLARTIAAAAGGERQP